MENKLDIIFLGLAQNCGKYLPTFFNTIDKISNRKKLKFFIGENGSNIDFTLMLFKKLYQIIFMSL